MDGDAAFGAEVLQKAAQRGAHSPALAVGQDVEQVQVRPLQGAEAQQCAAALGGQEGLLPELFRPAGGIRRLRRPGGELGGRVIASAGGVNGTVKDIQQSGQIRLPAGTNTHSKLLSVETGG